MRKLIALVVLLTFPGFVSAAVNNLTATTIVKLDASTGNDANGGGFDASAGTCGTDLSTGSPILVSGVTNTGSGSTTITATGSPWTSAVVCNAIQFTSFTNGTANSFYIVTAFIDANNLTLNVSPCPTTACTSGVTRIGGPLLTIGKAFTAVVSGTNAYLKVGIYAMASAATLSTAGTISKLVNFEGYTTTPGDNGQATLQMSTNSLSFLVTANASFQRIANVIIDCNSKTGSSGLNFSGGGGVVENVTVTGGCTNDGISVGTAQTVLRNNVVKNMVSCTASHGAFYLIAQGNLLLHNRATGNACTGFWDSINGQANVYIGNISDNNTGASSDGFYKTTGATLFMVGNVAYLNGRDGYRFDNANSLIGMAFYNNVCWHTSGTCVNSNVTSHTGFYLPMDYNAIGGGATARAGLSAGTHDQTLTADPFVAGGSNNFAPNTAAGGGALLRGNGLGTVPGGVGTVDIGAIQSTSSPTVGGPISQ